MSMKYPYHVSRIMISKCCDEVVQIHLEASPWISRIVRNLDDRAVPEDVSASLGEFVPEVQQLILHHFFPRRCGRLFFTFLPLAI